MADATPPAVRDGGQGGAAAPIVSARNLRDYARDQLDAAGSYPRAALAQRVFRLPRLDLTVWFASESLARLCEARLIGRMEGQPARTRAEIHAMDSELSGWAPPARWDISSGFSSREFERILAGAGLRGFYDHDAPSWQIYEPASGVGVQSLPTGMGIPAWERGSPLRLFLHWAYAAAGLRLTHAAALGLDGRGALIVGPSGAGKSATTLAGLRNGLDSVGDDYVLLEEGPAIAAHALFGILKQDRQWLLRAGVPPAIVDGVPANWRGKIELDAELATGRRLAASMEIGALLIPEVAHASRTAIERVETTEAALALAPSAVFQLPGDGAEGFRFFARIARGLPAYKLRLSEDPAEIAGAIGAFLARGTSLAG